MSDNVDLAKCQKNLEVPINGQVTLPNGCTLFWYPDGNGGRKYISDEVGGGVDVWTPCLVDFNTLLAAMTVEATLERIECERREKAQRRIDAFDSLPDDYEAPR